MDITQLGVKVELVGVEKAAKQLEDLAKSADVSEVKLRDVGDTANTSLNKTARALKDLADAQLKVSKAELEQAKARSVAQKQDDSALSAKVARENAYAASLTKNEQQIQDGIEKRKVLSAKAEKEIEAALLNTAKIETEISKKRRVDQQRDDSAAAAKISRENAYASAIEKTARLEKQSAAAILTQESRQNSLAALQTKYESQAQAILQRSTAYKLNQSSLVENRALKTQASILQGESRLALQQEKFEFQKAQAAERAARRVGGAWSSVKEMLSTFSTIVVGGFGIDAIVGKATEIVKVADNMTLLDSRLKLATKSQEDFVKTQTALRESSLKTGLNLEAQIDGFTQLERSTRAMKLSSEQLTFLTESFGKAAVVSGASTESYKSALTQLNQGFASGVIRGQEFNSVAEQAPAVMEALAAGMRGTNKEFDDLEKKGFLGVAALRKMAGEGKLVNSTTIPALIEGLKQTNKQFEEMPLTAQRATEQIATAYKVWISTQNEATNSTKGLAAGLGFIASNFSTIADAIINAGGVIAAILTGKLVASIIASEKAMSAASVVSGKYSNDLRNAAASALAQATAEQAAAKAVLDKGRLQMLSATQITQAQRALDVATANVTARQQEYSRVLETTTVRSQLARTATTAFGTVVGALGGPIGIGITAIIALITYWDDLKKAIFGATEAHADFMKQQGQVSTAMRGEDITKSIEAQIKHTENLKKQYADLNKEIKSGAAIVNSRTGEVDVGKQKRANDQLALLSAQIRESSLKQNDLDLIRRQRNADVTGRAQQELEKPTFAGGPQPEDKKTKFKTTEESIGTEKILEGVKDQLQIKNKLAEQEKALIGYSKEATLNEISILEKRELQLDTSKKIEQISEILNNKNAKFAAGVRESLQEQYNNLVKNRGEAEKQLELAQTNRLVINNMAKIDEERGTAVKAFTKASKERYSLEVAFLGQLDEELTYLEAVGGMKSSQVASERKALALQKERASFEKEVGVLRENLVTAELKLESIRLRGGTVSRDLLNNATAEVEAARELVQSREKEYSIAVRTYEMEKKTADLRSDMLAGIAKAFADYEDGADNLYAKGEEIAKGVINNLETIFSDFVSNGKLEFDDLFDYLKQELKKIAVQEIFIKPFTKEAQGILSFASGGASGSGNSQILDAIGAAKDWFMGTETGTNVSSWFSNLFDSGSGAAGSATSTAGATSSLSSIGPWIALITGSIDFAKGVKDAFKSGDYGDIWKSTQSAQLINQFFGGGGGEKFGGFASSSEMGRLYTPSQADAQLTNIVSGVSENISALAKQLGISAGTFGVGLGFDTDPSGSAGNRVSSRLLDSAGQVIYESINRQVEDAQTGVAVEAQRLALAAIKSSNLPEEYAKVFNGVDIRSATQEQITTMQAALQAIKLVSDTFNQFAKAMPQLSDLAFDAKENLVLLSGGLESLTNNLSTYYQNFYSEAEQAAFKMKDLEDKFKDLNVVMPSTKEAFRALVESQDLSTESGRKLYASLLSLSGAFVSVTESAKQALGNNLNNLLSDLQKAVDAEKQALKKALDAKIAAIEKERDAKLEALNKQLEAEKDVYSKLQNALGLVSSALDSVQSQIGISLSDRTSSISSLYGILSGVNSGTNLSDFTELEKVLGIISEPSEQLYSSFEDYAIDQAKAKAVLMALNDKGEVQLSKADLQIRATERLITATQEESEELIKLLQAEYDLAINQWDVTLKYYEDSIKSALDMTEAILSIPDAIKSLESATAAAIPPTTGGVTSSNPVYTGPGSTPTGTTSPQQTVNDLYNKILGRDADVGGLVAYSGWIMQGKSLDEVANSLLNSAEYKSKVDGSHADGLSYVPFDGYRAELHRGERVLTAEESKSYAASAEENKSLLKELISICKQEMINTHLIVKKLDKFDNDGLPETRTV